MTAFDSRQLAVADVLSALPPETDDLVRRIVRAAGPLGLRVYLVGGPVRDFLLGRAIRDVDLLVQVDPDRRGDESDLANHSDGPAAGAPSPAARLAAAAAATSGRVVEHGRFGTVRLEEEGAHVDLASARRETYRRPGALPDVESGSFEDDMARRDFSVNAIAIELPSLRRGTMTEVRDPLGGLEDLEERRLRILHPSSFHDDPTRALRAARLAARLDFSVTRSTRSALRDALRDGAFGGVSGERLRREIQRCFSDAALGLNPAQALRLLASWHVLPALEPGLTLARESIAPLRRHGRWVQDPQWKHAAAPPWQAGLALWLSPMPAALRRRTLARFSIRGEAATRIGSFPKTSAGILREIRGLRGRGPVDELLSPVPEDTLQALHAVSHPPERKKIVRWAAEDRPRRSPVTGGDLLELGLEGAEVGRVLARIRTAYLDGEVANREEALALATEFARRKGRAQVPAKRRRSAAKRAAKSRKRPPRKPGGSA